MAELALAIPAPATTAPAWRRSLTIGLIAVNILIFFGMSTGGGLGSALGGGAFRGRSARAILWSSLGVVGCFALLAHRGMRLALLAERPFRRYLAAGIILGPWGLGVITEVNFPQYCQVLQLP